MAETLQEKTQLKQLIEALVKNDLLKDLQSSSNQQKKQFEEAAEKRFKTLKEEVKNMFKMAVEIDAQLMAQSESLADIWSAQLNNSDVNNGILDFCTTLTQKYNDNKSIHDLEFKEFDKIRSDLNNLNAGNMPVDESRKTAKELFDGSENKHMFMNSKREAIEMNESEMVEFRKQIEASQQELDQLSE